LRNRVFELSANRVFASVENSLAFYRQRLDDLTFRLDSGLNAKVGWLKGRWQLLAADVNRFDLLQVIRFRREALNSQLGRLQARIQLFLQSVKGRTEALEGALQALSPLAVLDRGYSICRDGQGNVLKDARSLQVGDPFSVRLAKGSVDGRAEELHPSET
jgi:exodeoxyribonuclease VII large subunit